MSNQMTFVRARAIAAELEKMASADGTGILDKVACGLYARDLDQGKIVDLVISQPPSNIQDIRELAGQYLQASLSRGLQDEELHASPQAMQAKLMRTMADALRARINYLEDQKELNRKILEQQAQGMNPATAAAAQFPGQLTPGMAGQAPQGAPQGMPMGAPQGMPPGAPQAAPQGPPPLPSSPMEAAGGGNE